MCKIDVEITSQHACLPACFSFSAAVRVLVHVCRAWLNAGRWSLAYGLVRYCHPIGADGDGLSGYERLFTPDEPMRAGSEPSPDDSTLQAAFLGHVAGGRGRWVGGGCVLLKEDVESWGEQVYFTQQQQPEHEPGQPQGGLSVDRCCNSGAPGGAAGRL